MDFAATGGKFKALYGQAPDWVVRAPGRVNLIGEHIDYNGGPVLPMAIEREVVAAARRRDDRILRIASVGSSKEYRGSLPVKKSDEVSWANYPLGVMAEFEKLGVELPGLEILYESDVPLGAGLSSSAAMEVATAEILKAAAGVDLSPMETALLAQRAENRFVGVSCGLMDQAASACTVRSKLLLLDCGSRIYEQVDFPSDSITVVIAHSGVRRGLSTSAYNRRRSECDEALRLIHSGTGESYSNLCSVPREVFESEAKNLPEVLVRRARHVIGETERVHRAVEFLRTGDPEGAGKLLNESHFSLRDDYEVSCPELDALTELCRDFEGVFGSRLTGAGFGGCTVTLTRPERAGELIEMLRWDYYEERGLEPLAFASLPAQGVEVVFRLN